MLNLLNKHIQNILSIPCNKKILFLGMGNDFRSDDGIGIYIVNKIQSHNSKINILNLRNTPEMYLDEIVKIKPDKTILFDAAHFDGQPGEIRSIPQEQINNFTLSTHTFPPGVIAELIQYDTNSEVFFIGIQGQNFELGETISPKVKQAGDVLIKFIQKEIKKCMN